MHISVLLHETLEGLALAQGDHIFEGTVGLGGHSEEILKRIGASGVYIGTDEDAQALAMAKERLALYPARKIFVEDNFRNLDRVLDEAGHPVVDKILLDIGLSNLQLEGSGRGFSFKRDEPLVMTFKTAPKEGDLTAYEIVNEWAAESLADIIAGYGEERFSWRIAQAIVAARQVKPVETTNQLVDIVTAVVPSFARHGRVHPATKTFQAIRIAVNDELGALREGLAKGFARLAPQGRMAVISFHSLEDRIVKDFFKKQAEEGLGTIITKKPLTPSDEELAQNPKSRSAKLRIIQKN
ncbi:MAG: 16S rRNA (cytosine(1402)-N(4))-methyltransferase RsmH [Minisyncoccota bacterium]